MEIVSKYKVILKHFFFEALKLLWNALFIAATVDHNNWKSDFYQNIENRSTYCC